MSKVKANKKISLECLFNELYKEDEKICVTIFRSLKFKPVNAEKPI